MEILLKNYLLPGTRKSQLSICPSRLIGQNEHILTFARYPNRIMVFLQEIFSHFSLMKLSYYSDKNKSSFDRTVFLVIALGMKTQYLE